MCIWTYEYLIKVNLIVSKSGKPALLLFALMDTIWFTTAGCSVSEKAFTYAP